MQVGEKLGSFRITGTLGVGAMGVVYKAVHDPSERPAAVKVVNKDLVAKGKTAERFDREAKILQQFRHPNIVRFYAMGRYQGTSYIAMEFIQGKTLEQLLEERGGMPWQEVVDLGAQLCEALQYAHDHGVIHRDLKPSNLMITHDGKVKLTDFGIAKDLDETALTATGRTLGTAAYMAPEQIRGAPEVSHKTDLYALGCVLYQMLTGQAPFSGSTHVVLMNAHLNAPAPRASGKVAEIPKALDNLILQLMAKSPMERPWDAAFVATALAEIRDKAQKGEAVPMVWATDLDATSALPLPMGLDTSVAKKGKRKKSRSSSSEEAPDEKSPGRKRLETAAMVLALCVLGGAIAYPFLPASQEYLYKHAQILMDSKDWHDWRAARDEYFEPLERKYPNHPYKEATRAWRDKLGLREIEDRAGLLQSEANTKFNKPEGEIERRWVEYYIPVAAAKKRHDDLAELHSWEETAKAFRSEDPSERAWHLLATRNHDHLKTEIAERREDVLRQLTHAQDFLKQGKTVEAAGLLRELRTRYGEYASLADLLSPQPAPDAPKAPAEAEKSETPEGGENP